MALASRKTRQMQDLSQVEARSSCLQGIWLGVRRSPSGMIGLVIVVAHLSIALSAPFVVPYSPVEFDPTAVRAVPSATHFFGTDELGRDILTRTLLGGRTALLVTLSSTAIAVTWGGLLGITVGYIGGLFDNVVMRLVDAILALPQLLILVLLVGLFGSGNGILISLLGFLSGVSVVRIARAMTLGLIGQEFISAAYALGARRRDIILRHLLPNVLDMLLVEGTLRWSWMLLSFSTLSFLGFGVTPPTPDWGLMIANGRDVLAIAPWVTFFPLAAVSTLIIGANLLVDALGKSLGNR